METKSPEQLQQYARTKTNFTDYFQFRDQNERRVPAREAFLHGEEYAPKYTYPRLETLYDKKTNDSLAEKKTRIYEAAMELRAAAETAQINGDEYQLYADYYEAALKRILLVEAMRRLHTAGSSSENAVAREDVRRMSIETYGEFDRVRFEGMMHTEARRVEDFVPHTPRAVEIKAYLEQYFSRRHFVETEKELLDCSLISALQAVLHEKFGAALMTFPDTDETVMYSAEQSCAIVQASLDASELGAKGWTAKVSTGQSNVSTNHGSKAIILPSTLELSSKRLQCTTIHEQIHALRGQNGRESGVRILGAGTASYAGVEEGLGVLMECALMGGNDNESFHRARDRYIVAGLAWGVDGAPKDAYTTHALLWRLIALRRSPDGNVDEALLRAAQLRSMYHIDSAFSGTNFAMPGMIFPKLKIYYEGLAKNADYFSAHRDDVATAFEASLIGKHDHTNADEREVVQTLIDRYRNTA